MGRPHIDAAVLLIPAALLAVNACAPDPVHFDARRWREGDQVRRGAMAQELVDSHILVGRSSDAVIALLGPPDHKDSRWLGYKIMPISRCHLWECRLDIALNGASGIVESATVSD